ncbi:Hsp70 family protein [Yoonia sp. R2331]|uniref:Hsp70 family protein n=1 Tax=Yoonia sp. R2331 TaxID=3237238 RepID=UPI0034E452BA
MARLGIDFGTSNTAAGVMAGDRPFLIPVEGGETTLPTSVFFDPDRKITLFGNAANRALIDGREGRFMRALKSVLGTSLMHEKRVIAHERLTLIEVVARFLAMLRERAEATTGQTYDTALSGRPVQFHSTDAARNARAEDDLRAAYMAAGYKDVDFMFEPEAAALTAGPLEAGTYGLIVDIGGGTSDFSVFAQDPATRIVASHGVRIGGTDFDRTLSLAHVMPLLGRGTAIRNEMGPGSHTAPNAIYNDLATWEKIAFLYSPDNLRLAKRYAKLGVDPVLFQRLATVIEEETGHDLAFATERAKIAANAEPTAQIDLRIIERGLSAPLTSDAMSDALSDYAAQIAAAASETLTRANVAPRQINQIVFVGGSSLMGVVASALTTLLPAAAPQQAAAFTAVADGLAMASAR